MVNDDLIIKLEEDDVVTQEEIDKFSSREPLKIVIFVEGGMIQTVLISSGNVDAYIVDYDVDGSTDEDVIEVPFSDGDKPKAFVGKWELREQDRDPQFIDRLEKECKKRN